MGLSSPGGSWLRGLGSGGQEAAGMRAGVSLRCSVSSAAWPDGEREIYRETKKRDREIKERERERNPGLSICL